MQSSAERLAPRYEDESYYTTKQEPGLDRLCAELRESAFWSQRLYRLAWQASLAVQTTPLQSPSEGVTEVVPLSEPV